MDKRSYFTLTRPTRAQYLTVGIVCLVAVVGVAAYRNAGRWLLVRSRLPERLDVIFAFGGETARETHALRLAEQYSDAVLIISSPSASRTRTLLGPHLDTARTLIVDSLKNTWDEVRFLRRWLDRRREEEARARELEARNDSLSALLDRLQTSSPTTQSVKDSTPARVDSLSALSRRNRVRDQTYHVALVSGPYHMRRIKIAAVRLLNNRSLRLYYAPAALELYGQSEQQYRCWWRHPALRALVRNEVRKSLYYLVRL